MYHQSRLEAPRPVTSRDASRTGAAAMKTPLARLTAFVYRELRRLASSLSRLEKAAITLCHQPPWCTSCICRLPACSIWIGKAAPSF